MELNNVAFEHLESRINENFRSGFGVLLQKINDITAEAIQVAILTAEEIESTVKREFESFRNSSLNVDKNKSSKVKNHITSQNFLRQKMEFIQNCNPEEINQTIDNKTNSMGFTVIPKVSSKAEMDINRISISYGDQLDMENLNAEKANPNLFQCDRCNYQAKLKTNLSRHVATVHEKVLNYECELCNKAFGSKVEVQRHSKRWHPEVNC